MVLRRSRDFERVMAFGTRRRVGGLVVIAVGSDSAGARVGVVAGRRVGNAVRRNRAKRRLRHALARRRLAGGTDYVVVASASVVDAPFATVERWLDTALDELGAAEEEVE